jgi:septum formation protein
MKIILGSSSKYRKALLQEHGYEVEVISPDINEEAIRSDNYYELPLLLARAKATALLPKVSTSSIMVTADVVVICRGDLYEKPKNAKEARSFLETYSGGPPAEVIAALVVNNTANGKQAEGVDMTSVHFNFIPLKAIDSFIKEGDPFTKAGGFGIQSPILQPYIKEIRGSRESIMGMPMQL